MANDQNVELQIIAKNLTQAAFQEVSDSLKSLGTASADMGTGVGTLNTQVSTLHGTEKDELSTFETMTKRIGERILIYASFGEALRVVKDLVIGSVEAFGEAEAAEQRLTVALQTQGLAIPHLADQYLQLGETFEQTTAFSHTAIDAAEALFIQLGNVGPDMMGRALKAATDLSAGLGMDLNASVELLSRAAEGQTQSFTRYGIVLDQARVKSEGFGYVLDAIEQKVGGQAQGELDTYAGKVKQLGNAWDDVKEAIGKAIVEDPLVVAALQEVTAALKAHKDGVDQSTASWAKWLIDAVPVVSEFEAIRDAAERATKAKQDFDASVAGATSAIPGLPAANLPPTDFLQQLDAQSKQQVAAQKTLAEAAKKSAEEIQTLHDTLFGQDVIKKANQYVVALGSISNIAKLTADSHKTLADAMQKAVAVFVAEGHEIPTSIANIAQALHVMTPDIKMVDDLTASVLKLGTVSASVYGALPTEGTVPNLPTLSPLTTGRDQLPGVTLDLSKVLTIPDAPQTFAQMMIGDPAKFGESLSSTVLHAVEGGGNPIEAIGSKVGGDFGKNIATEAGTSIETFFKGAFGGSLGKALGSAFTAAIPIIGSLIGPALQSLSGVFDHFFGTAGRDAVTTFASSMGGFDALHQQLDQLGAAGEQMWVQLTQDTGRNDLPAAQAEIQKIQTAIDGLHTSENSQMQDLISKIQSFGGSIDPALDPYIQKLEQAGILTADNAKALQGLEGTGGPSLDQLTQLQQKYNLTAAQMGSSFQTQQIDANFQSLIDDMKELSDGGADVTAAMFNADGSLSGLGTTIEQDIAQAKAAGVQIPANLKDAATALIQQGDLLDANGNKITDVSQLDFGTTMQTDLENLTTTLQNLIATLTGNDPNSFATALKTVGGMEVHPKVIVDTEWPDDFPGNGGGPAGGGGVPQHAAGAYIREDHLAMVHAGEMIGDQTFFGAAIGRALAGAGNGGGPIEIHVHAHLDGREITSTVVRHMPDELRRFGIRTH